MATSVKITRQNTAENQMSIAGQVAVMAAANQPGSGDCDSDGFVEPLEWRDAGVLPKPTGGGLVPPTIGIAKKDPWGTEYGYCVWDHGPQNNGGGTCGGGAQKRLSGFNAGIYPVVALVSAGPDKTFTTTCRTFDDADANNDNDLEDAGIDFALVQKANDSEDDIIFTYTYEEATGASGGLWSLKSGDPDTAVIDKKIESTGAGSFAGGILLPDSSLITCDPTTAGIMARNASGDGISICDGTDWEEISGGTSTPYGVGLIITPNTSSGMNITAPCGNPTCYSSNVVFAVTNKLDPPATSAVLAVTITGSGASKFEKVSDTCNGQAIPAGGNCQITVRARASGNIGYAAQLNIIGNNSPFANMDGVANGFGCTIGGDAPGGKYVACAVGGYNLITTPSGCTSSPNNPTCPGGAETFALQTSPANSFPIVSSGFYSTSGQQNTANMMAYTGGSLTFPAAQWCNSLEYGGYDDWFLPSASEVQLYYCPNQAILGGSGAGSLYLTSTGAGNAGNNWHMVEISGCYLNSGYTGGTNARVRCMRWDPVRSVTPTTDTTPHPVTLNLSSGTVAGQVRTSNTVIIEGITIPVNLSISGGISAEYSKNGGAYSTATTTVVNGDAITLRATSPVAGQSDSIILTLGSSSLIWTVQTVANNTIYAFVTSATANGSLTISGADGMCASAASSAGLGGTWIAYLAPGSGAGNGPTARLPWNWTIMKNMNNAVIANGYSDFIDGALSAPINRTATNALSAYTYAWTGASDSTGTTSYSGHWGSSLTCTNWTSASGAGFTGVINSTTTGISQGPASSTGCGGAYPVYCIQDPGSTLIDTDPADVGLRPGIAYSPGAAAVSNTVTITSILQPVTVTITPSAGTADIIVNGVPQGAASVSNVAPNATVQFSLTVPAVLGTKNTATITIGDDTYNWWVGYADSAKNAHAFVAYTGGLAAAIGGLTGADGVCNTMASQSTYGLSGSWRAMLSDSNTNMMDRISWNWGSLKTVDGTNIVDGGFVDLFDGTLDGPINKDKNGNIVSAEVFTGTSVNGIKKYTVENEPGPVVYCQNWTTNGANGYCLFGQSFSTSSTWTSHGTGWDYTRHYIYCMEDVDTTTDNIPNVFMIPYPVQVPTSSRQTSQAILVSGMSSGVSAIMSVTATGGTPTFKVNGGPEVTSASVTNGDSVVFLMDAPATGNTFNKMTITAGGVNSYWRVWTGDTTGLVVKRIFVAWYGYGVHSTNQGGITGADALCQSKATSAALGGTWKALASGQGDDESQWAVNRIGYNWTTLRRVDGVDVVHAGNIWSARTTPLVNPILKDQAGTSVSVTMVATGSDEYGKAAVRLNTGQCGAFTNASAGHSAGYQLYRGSSGTTNEQWISNGGIPGYGCHSYELQGLYCIEQ